MARGPWHEEADFVVVGASVGGLAAAVLAADRGCRTIIVERTKELGGGAAGEAETIAAAGSRWQHAAGIGGRVREDSGAVRGVSVRGERRGASQALGGRVLLACGGFAGDDALAAEHCPPVAELPFQGGARATGDGLRLGREAGAATRRLASWLVTPFLATPGQLVLSAPLVELGAALVNQAG